jgi:hypothetical protein
MEKGYSSGVETMDVNLKSTNNERWSDANAKLGSLSLPI